MSVSARHFKKLLILSLCETRLLKISGDKVLGIIMISSSSCSSIIVLHIVGGAIVYNFVIYYIKLKSRPSAVFWSCGSPPWMQGLTSNLHETKRLSYGITKFIFKSLKSLSNGTCHKDNPFLRFFKIILRK